MSVDEIGTHQYRSFCQFLEQTCGIVLGENKQYLVKSRLTSLVSQHAVNNLNDFIELVTTGNKAAKSAAIEAMTTNETLWFRDSYPFKLLESEFFPALSQNPRVRVWSAACSSGQEPYSIAMNWLNYKKQSVASSASIQIVATDISNDMLEICKNGEYDSLSIARGLPSQCQRDYFEPLEGNKLKVKPELQRLIEFRQINLLESYQALGKFDIVFCRNVLIYFSAEVKKQILQKIAACLQDKGILFLGASESISELTDQFELKRSPIGLFYQKKTS